MYSAQEMVSITIRVTSSHPREQGEGQRCRQGQLGAERLLWVFVCLSTNRKACETLPI